MVSFLSFAKSGNSINVRDKKDVKFSGIKPTGNFSVAISSVIPHPKNVMPLTGKQSDVQARTTI